MVDQAGSYMEAERGYQNVKKYYNFMRTKIGTFVTISTLLLYLYATGQWYYIALQLFSNIYHLIYVGHVSIIN